MAEGEETQLEERQERGWSMTKGGSLYLQGLTDDDLRDLYSKFNEPVNEELTDLWKANEKLGDKIGMMNNDLQELRNAIEQLRREIQDLRYEQDWHNET